MSIHDKHKIINVVKKTSTFKKKVEAQTGGGAAGGGIPELIKIF